MRPPDGRRGTSAGRSRESGEGAGQTVPVGNDLTRTPRRYAAARRAGRGTSVRRWAAVVAGGLATLGAGLALALTADGQTPPDPGFPAGARPEVVGSARTLVPFGIETTADGPRAWALGQAAGRTVVLRRAPRGGWTSAPLPVAGKPVGGAAPQHAGEVAADGRGAILLADPDQPDRDAQLLVRAPGETFVAAPAPDAALAAGERLVANATRPDARALLAVIGGAKADAATLLAPTNADGVATAVLRLDADGWHREAIDGGAVKPVGLAAAGPARAWLLATAGDRVVLLHREASPDGEPQWVPTTVPEALLAGEALPAKVASVSVDAAPADPLTVTADGLWLDLRVTPAGATAPVDVTEHVAITGPAPAETPTPTATTTATATPTATDTRHRDAHRDRVGGAHVHGLAHRHGDADPHARADREGRRPLVRHIRVVRPPPRVHVRARRPRLPLGRRPGEGRRPVRHARGQRPRRHRRPRGRARP